MSSVHEEDYSTVKTMEGLAHTMEDGAGPADSFTSGVHSPTDSKAAARFDSYREYVAKLKCLPTNAYYPEGELLWLASFNGNGHCIGWDYCDFSDPKASEARRLPPEEEGSGFRPSHASVLPPPRFCTLLQTPDKDVVYRVIIVAVGHEGYSSKIHKPLGLGLGLGEDIFLYVSANIYADSSPNLPQPWSRDFPALRVGGHTLCIPENASGKAPKTGIHEAPTPCSWVG